MNLTSKKQKLVSPMVTFYHDIEQNIDYKADLKECRNAVKDFLKLEKKYNVPATYNIVGKLFQEKPELIKWILDENQEIAFHSFNHQSDWKSEYYSNEIELCRKISDLPFGYRSPRSQWDQTTLKCLWENGFLWNSEADKHKEPYFIYKGLVRLPIAGDDWPLYKGVMSLDEWAEHFSELLKRRRYFAFGSHDFITSFAPRERLKAWEKILKIAIENKALLVTSSEAADLFRRAALSHHYSLMAKNWNRNTKTLYRTKRFQEMVRGITEKLNQPVIADLGSGGGVLSSPLKDIAKKIYCVDNAPGMVADVDQDSCIGACLGEAHDSNLPDNSIDFVICARIIEYLFWPNRLADEIKRIGKIGATYFVTFPAARKVPPPQEGSPPNKIRHYFTKDEIEDWANEIGPGRLIGIQYEKQKSDNSKTEHQYREFEKNPPADTYPTNWVYIGIIKNKSKLKEYRKTIPVSDFEFRFSDQRYNHLKMYLINFRSLLLKSIRKSGNRN